MRATWIAVVAAVGAVSATGGFVAGRAGRPAPASSDAVFARLLDQSGVAADPVATRQAVGRPVDQAARAYATRLLGLAGSTGADPRSLDVARRAAAAGQAVAGLADADGDGLDDDGTVQVGAACLLLPISASYDVKLRPGACSGAEVHPSVGDAAYGPKRFPESYLRTL